MKILVLALIFVGVFFLYQITIGRVKHNFQTCLDNLHAAQAESEDSSCAEKRKPFQDLNSCVIAVQKNSSLASFLYGPLGSENDVNLAIATHNEECPTMKVDKPTEGLYVNY